MTRHPRMGAVAQLKVPLGELAENRLGEWPTSDAPRIWVTHVSFLETRDAAALVPTGWNESYSYNSFGSMLRNGSFPASYMANNQMFGYLYDAAGNLLSDRVSNLMTWHTESRLSSAGGATYSYEPMGNRVGKNGVGLMNTVYFGGRPIARFTAGQWTDLVYGPAGLLAEVPVLRVSPPSIQSAITSAPRSEIFRPTVPLSIPSITHPLAESSQAIRTIRISISAKKEILRAA